MLRSSISSVPIIHLFPKLRLGVWSSVIRDDDATGGCSSIVRDDATGGCSSVVQDDAAGSCSSVVRDDDAVGGVVVSTDLLTGGWWVSELTL